MSEAEAEDFEVLVDRYNLKNAEFRGRTDGVEKRLQECGDRIIQIPNVEAVTTFGMIGGERANAVSISSGDVLAQPYDRYTVRICTTDKTILEIAVRQVGEQVYLYPVITDLSNSSRSFLKMDSNKILDRLTEEGYVIIRNTSIVITRDANVFAEDPDRAYQATGRWPLLNAFLMAADNQVIAAFRPSAACAALIVWLMAVTLWYKRCEGRTVQIRQRLADGQEKAAFGDARTPCQKGMTRVVDLGKKIVVYDSPVTEHREFGGYHIAETQRCGYVRHYKSGKVIMVRPTTVHFRKLAGDCDRNARTTLICRDAEKFLREKSYLEDDVLQMLLRHGIRYEREKTFPWLGRKRLDFFLPDLNIAIECQGVQHFYPYHLDENGQDPDFAARRQRDEDKKKECREHDVKLLYLRSSVPLPKWAEESGDVYFENPEKMYQAYIRDASVSYRKSNGKSGHSPVTSMINSTKGKSS